MRTGPLAAIRSLLSSPRLCGIMAFALISQCASAKDITQIPRPSKVDVSAVTAIAPQSRDQFYEDLRGVRRKVAPRVIFVPGIMGSKIEECRSDNSQCKTIWGTVGAIADKSIDMSVKPDRAYRTDVVESMLFQDIYGNIVNYIRRNSEEFTTEEQDDQFVTVFHYDWRISNSINASKLSTVVCNVREANPSSPIYIVSHSMGGLITKIWAKNYGKKSCPSNRQPNVEEIVFVATPHLGAPKAIKAVVDGYNLLFDDFSRAPKILGSLERNYIMDNVNKSGISFQSLYELLPIQTSEYCLNQKPSVFKNINPVVEGDNSSQINMFDVNTWKQYDLLKRINEPPLKAAFYKNDLSDLLKRAEVTLCDLVDFDPSSIANVTYVFGRGATEQTIGWLKFQRGSGDLIVKSTAVQGDGTVPTFSAENILVSKTNQIKEAAADHVSIISNPVVLRMVDQWYARASKRADLDLGKRSVQYASMLSSEMAATGRLLSISSNPRTWEESDEKLAIGLDRDALRIAGYTPASLAAFADIESDLESGSRLYAIAAAVDGSITRNDGKPQDLLEPLNWLQSSARLAYVSKRYPDAIAASEFVREKVKGTPFLTNAIALQKQATEVETWAYLRSGDVDRFNSLSTAYSQDYSVAATELKEPSIVGRWKVQDLKSNFAYSLPSGDRMPDPDKAVVQTWQDLTPSPAFENGAVKACMFNLTTGLCE